MAARQRVAWVWLVLADRCASDAGAGRRRVLVLLVFAWHVVVDGDCSFG